MASLTVSPLPHKLGITTSRRIPLGDIPNAANSPARTYAALKRSRDQVEAQENFSHDVQPQAKRRFFDNNGSIGCLSPTKPGIRSKDDPDFTKRPSNPQLTAFERRCLATREDKAQQKVERFEKPPQETLEGIRQWQKHYKKAFPQFVFYFEGVPEDVRQKCSKWVRTLGAVGTLRLRTIIRPLLSLLYSEKRNSFQEMLRTSSLIEVLPMLPITKMP